MKVAPFALGLCLAVLPALSAGAQDVTLRYNRWLPATHDIDNKVFKPWFDEIARVTGGRVKVEFTTSSLGPLPRQYELAKSGVADITFGSESLTPGLFPLAEILELPFLGDSAESVSVAYWRVYKKYFEKTHPYQGTHLLALSSLAPYYVHTAKKPVAKIADFGGMKLRAAGTLLNDTVSALGAVAVSASVTELHELFSKGIVDGGLSNDDQIRSFALTKYIAYRTVIAGGISNYSTFVTINAGKWEAIAPADRAAIEKIAGESVARSLGRIIDASAKLGVEQMREAGTKTIVADKDFVAALKQKLGFLEQRWIKKAQDKGVDGKAALEMLRAEAASYKP
ncbi:MAG: TRAP transporter substrate-binding protein [Candidatus Eiseniibacteriota bacterium]